MIVLIFEGRKNPSLGGTLGGGGRTEQGTWRSGKNSWRGEGAYPAIPEPKAKLHRTHVPGGRTASGFKKVHGQTAAEVGEA